MAGMPDTGTNNPTEKTFINGAIYTRKSHEEGLEQEFNSLDAQREAAEAYIEKVVLEQLSAVFRTPTLVSRTYFAAKGMEDAGRERLLKRKERLEDDLLTVRERALEEGTLDGNGSDPGPTLVELNREAVTLSRQLTDVSARVRAFEADPVAEREVAEAFQSVETFWEDLFPLERNRLIRLLVEKVDIRETGIDMELKTRGLTSLIIELSGLASEARERSHGR